jgi:hypothetical protein
MATLPDTLGPLHVTCEHCGHQLRLDIPVRIRRIDGRMVEVEIPDDRVGDVETAVGIHIRQHE